LDYRQVMRGRLSHLRADLPHDPGHHLQEQKRGLASIGFLTKMVSF
jgi:hypothetical protein